MDKADAKTDYAPAGVSIRNGPVNEMDVDTPITNGTSKRKARTSTSKSVNYNVDSSEGDSDEDAVPLVRQAPTACSYGNPPLQTLIKITFMMLTGNSG
jgi:DNA topoisomerase-1